MYNSKLGRIYVAKIFPNSEINVELSKHSSLFVLSILIISVPEVVNSEWKFLHFRHAESLKHRNIEYKKMVVIRCCRQ